MPDLHAYTHTIETMVRDGDGGHGFVNGMAENNADVSLLHAEGMQVSTFDLGLVGSKNIIQFEGIFYAKWTCQHTIQFYTGSALRRMKVACQW